MVKAVELDIKLQLPKATTPPLPRESGQFMDQKEMGKFKGVRREK
jgi:hypothetical protein